MRLGAELSRVLVAADSSIDPHRLVSLCCERPDSHTLSVSLLVPMDGAPLLRRATTLLDAAGVRLEDFIVAEEDPGTLDELVSSGEFESVLVCSAHDRGSPVLPLTARLARTHGLAVVESGRGRSRIPNWLKRVIGGA